MRPGCISSELVVCGGDVCSILLFPPVAKCLETIDVCIWRMGSVGIFIVQRPLLKIVVVFSIGVLKYVVCLCKGCDRC